MTTTTIPTATLAGTPFAAAASRLARLRAAFAFRLRTIGGSSPFRLLAHPVSLAKKVISMVPATVATMAVSLPLASRWGFDKAVQGLGLLGRFARWAFIKANQLTHTVIDWVGYRTADVVGIFSDTGANKVVAAVERFHGWRDIATGLVLSVGERVGSAVHAAVSSPFVRGSVNLVASVVTLSIAGKILVPTVFSTLTGALPFGGGLLAKVALGGMFPLGLIGGIAAVTTLLAMIPIAAYRFGTRAGREGRPFREVAEEAAARARADEDLLAAVRADERWMARYETAQAALAENGEMDAAADVLAASVKAEVGSKKHHRSGDPAQRGGK